MQSTSDKTEFAVMGSNLLTTRALKLVERHQDTNKLKALYTEHLALARPRKSSNVHASRLEALPNELQQLIYYLAFEGGCIYDRAGDHYTVVHLLHVSSLVGHNAIEALKNSESVPLLDVMNRILQLFLDGRWHPFPVYHPVVDEDTGE